MLGHMRWPDALAPIYCPINEMSFWALLGEEAVSEDEAQSMSMARAVPT